MQLVEVTLMSAGETALDSTAGSIESCSFSRPTQTVRSTVGSKRCCLLRSAA